MGLSRESAKNFLGEYAGILQTDGYTASDLVGRKVMLPIRRRAAKTTIPGWLHHEDLLEQVAAWPVIWIEA